MEKSSTLSFPDYIVIAIMMGISFGIGLYYKFAGKRQTTTLEYFTANRTMRSVPVGIALMVSFISAISMLGLSADVYSHGTQVVALFVPLFVVVPLSGYLYLPVFFKLEATSVYEYLERRFGKIARTAASLVKWLQFLLFSGICLYAPALTVEVTTGLPKFWSITSLGVVCSFYATVGGMKAVLMADMYQAALMFGSVIMVIVTAAYSAGGLAEVWRIAEEGGRIEFDNFSLDPTVRHTWWSLLIGGFTMSLCFNAVNQVQVQRLLTMKNIGSARIAMLINMMLYIMFSLAVVFSGLAIYSKYHDCDPKATGRVTATDMLMPLYVMDTLSHLPGLPGLFISGIFSATLSTISAVLNSLAAMTLEDYVKPVYTKYTGDLLPESKSLVISKLLTFSYGVLCISLAFSAQVIGSFFQYVLTVNGGIGSAVFGIFTLGMVFESANEIGAVIGLMTSLVIVLWLMFGRPRPIPTELSTSQAGCDYLSKQTETINVQSKFMHFPSPIPDDSQYFYLYRLSYLWYSVIAFVMCVALGLLASYVVRLIWGIDKDKEVDPDLFWPVLARRIRRKREIKNNS